MNTRFENYEELNDFDMIDTYYDEVKDYKYFIEELREDRVESQKYIVNANKEIEKLNNIIDELEKVINNCAVIGEFGTSKIYIDKQYLLNKLKELKEGK